MVLLLAALVLGAIAERLRQSAIVGFLLGGMLLGPNALQWVRSESEVEMLAELGVALLLTLAIAAQASTASVMPSPQTVQSSMVSTSVQVIGSHWPMPWG